VPSYPAGITVSNHALITVSDALRHRRTVLGTAGGGYWPDNRPCSWWRTGHRCR
jgi:hypothetical protein